MSTAPREQFVNPAFAEPRPLVLFLRLVCIYLLLQSFAFGFESGLFRLFSGAFAFVVFGVVLINSVFLSAWRRAPDVCGIGLPVILASVVYFVGMLGNLSLNRGNTDMQEWAKIFMAPAYLWFGYVAMAHARRNAWLNNSNRFIFGCLIVLPLLVWAVQLATGRTWFGGGVPVGMFANRNNAGLYFLALLAFYSQVSWRPVRSVIVILLAAVLFGTMGLMLATLVAVFIAVGRWRYLPRLMGALVAALILIALLPEELAWSRLEVIVRTIQYLAIGKINLATITYADLVLMLQTKDLSFIFRLKHWLDLLTQFAAGSAQQTLFGHGVGSAVQVSAARLVPHNDYVRLLFECGVLAFAGFVTLVWWTIVKIGRRWELVPLLAIALYFFSENLINNYLAMAVFFFSMGATLCRVRVGQAARGAYRPASSAAVRWAA